MMLPTLIEIVLINHESVTLSINSRQEGGLNGEETKDIRP
jgi:hypothetical protein